MGLALNSGPQRCTSSGYCGAPAKAAHSIPGELFRKGLGSGLPLHNLDLGALDPAERFLSRAHAAWERMTPAADRERYAWRPPVLGPAFLESVEGIAGVSRERIVEVCAHVASGRARDIPGLELHVLRTSETGGAPGRERADGAKAWRCSLQANTPAARRLHFWRLPDGSVELANVVYHDDFSIS